MMAVVVGNGLLEISIGNIRLSKIPNNTLAACQHRLNPVVPKADEHQGFVIGLFFGNYLHEVSASPRISSARKTVSALDRPDNLVLL